MYNYNCCHGVFSPGNGITYAMVWQVPCIKWDIAAHAQGNRDRVYAPIIRQLLVDWFIVYGKYFLIIYSINIIINK